MNTKTNIIDAAEAAAHIKQDPSWTLVDVRSGIEYRTEHIPGAVHIPLHRLNRSAVRKHLPPNGRIVFTCASGKRADAACANALAEGWPDVYVLRNGIAGWKDAGLPVAEGNPGISLERQVRIAAGALVLIGTALGILVHPAWLGLSGFTGAGLVFAGITNTCGMAMLLARMPWNQ